MISSLPSILFAGPMLGRIPGIVPNPMEILAPYLELRGYHCSLTSATENRYLRTVDILRTIILERDQYDILCLQVYSGRSFYIEDAASWLAARLNRPVVMVLHGGGMPQFIQQNHEWVSRVLHRAAAVITPSSYLAEAVRPLGIEANIIPNLLPMEHYPFRLRRDVRPRLIWMRAFHEIYNPEMALETLRLLRKQTGQAVLTMAGQEKGLLNGIKKKAVAAGLSENVHFVGFLDMTAKQQVFANHDIFLNTNRVDNMPISVLEAAAFGLPVIATNVGGISHLLEHEKNALLVRDGDPVEMAQAVCRLVEDAALAEKLSLAGRELAEHSDWPVVAPLWDRVFTKVRY